jgi:hypothetical protein
VLLVSVFVLAGGAPPADLRSLAGSMLLGLGGASLYFLAYAAFRAGPIHHRRADPERLGWAHGPPLDHLPQRATVAAEPRVRRVATLGVVLAGVVIGGHDASPTVGAGYRLRPRRTRHRERESPSWRASWFREESWLTALTFARITNAAIVLAVLLILRWRRRVTAPQARGPSCEADAADDRPCAD